MRSRNLKIKTVWVVSLLCLCTAILVIVGCSPSDADEQSGTDQEQPAEQSAIDFVWTSDADCSMCHAVESDSMTDSTCLASIHEQQGNTCNTCHTDMTGLEKAHEGATPELAEKRATKLRSTIIDEEVCFSCHGSYEELAVKTASYTGLADTQGTTVNPHALPENEDHADTNCASCHVMHSAVEASESAQDYCTSCHHANVYQCHTCHD